MPDEKLILTPFKKALQSLKKAIEQPKNEFTRDAAIQRFEYTYELSWKMLKRYLKTEANIDEFNVKNIFRKAARMKLIESAEHWFEYQKVRNLTSHTYNEKTAEETYRVIQKFLPDAEKLLENLEKLDGN